MPGELNSNALGSKDIPHGVSKVTDINSKDNESFEPQNEALSHSIKEGNQDTKEFAEKAKNQSVAFRSLFRYADSWDYLLMAIGAIGAIGLGAALPLMSLLFGELTDAFGQNTQSTEKLVDQVSATALKFVWLAIGAGVAGYLETTCWMITGERQSSRIRAKFLRAVLRQDIAFFDVDTSTGELLGRMSGDMVLLQEAMGEKVGSYIRLMSTFFGGFAMAFVRGWLLTFVMMAALPLLAVSGGIMTVVVSKATSKGQEAYGEAGNVVEQCVGAIRTVVSFAGELKAVQQYAESLERAYKMGCRQGLFNGLGIGTMLLVMFSSYALALWVGSVFIYNDIGDYTGGKVVSVLFAVIIGGMSLGQASPNLSAFASGKAAAYKIFQVIERVPAIDVFSTVGNRPEKVQGTIQLQNVNFHYPARPDATVFTNFSLTIPAGKTVALVGESGSGKSTVISLIERFYDPVDGSVLLDGSDLRSLNLSWLRSQIGLVSQEPVLFGGTIWDNIAYGCSAMEEGKEVSDEDIVKAAKMANVHNFISSLPNGYKTEVGERGAQLSGGQKQRVAIARAMLRNPPILLLDEATSALDAESERVVQEALERAMENRTTVVVAHRLSTIRNADLIAVLQRGTMVEQGTHDELVKIEGGAYAQLIRLQEMEDRKETEEEADDEKLAGLESPSHHITAESATMPSSQVKEKKLGILSFLSSASKEEQMEEGSLTVSSTSRKNKEVSIWRLARYNRPEWPFAVIGSLGAITQGCVFPVFAIILSRIIKAFYEPDRNELRDSANFWSLMFVLLGVACLVSLTCQIYMFAVMGSALVRRIREKCFHKLLHNEIAWFDDNENNSSGAIGARLSTDAALVRAMVGDSLALVVQNLTTCIAGLIIAFTANWTLSLVVLSVVPLLLFVGSTQMKAIKGFSEDAKVMYEDASKVANDAVSSIRTVAAFGSEKRMSQLYDDRCALPIQAGLRRGQVSGLGLGFSNFVMFSVHALAFWYGGQLVKDGKATFQEVFQVFFAILMSAMGVSQSVGLAPDLTAVKIAVNSIFNILDRKSKIDASTPGKTLGSIRGDIQFKDVKFRYPSRPDAPIFENLCLEVIGGQTFALVGESGSGKSTVISLIERFYDPLSGSVLIDGVDIRDLQLKWIRQQIGLVSQEPVLFNASIQDNIAYGQDGVTKEEIVAAAMDSNAHQFITSLPQGYDTVVGERGIQLSGGQKQRVAIARAIVKNPRILLLDEATSALDAESEHVVQEALDRVMVGRTTIVIAHRLTTIRNADVIAVVQKGVVVEQGQHDKLLAMDGAYAALVKLHKRI